MQKIPIEVHLLLNKYKLIQLEQKLQNTIIMKTVKTSPKIIFGALIAVLFAMPFSAISQSLAEAKLLSESGDHEAAELLFNQLLTEQPQNPEIILAHAYNLSWMGRNKQAVNQFTQAMRLGADTESAQTGLGYAYAWSKQYAQARNTFSSVARNQPDNLEAKKGIALTYLWQGQYEVALHYFDELLKSYPSNYDLLLGKGQALLCNKNKTEAATTFQQALEAQPESIEAKNYLEIAKKASNFLEGDLWLGFSHLDGDENKFGLRGLQLGAQLSSKWRGYLKYDNTLALDLLNFARLNKNAPFIAAGAVREWNSKLLTEMEYGLRFFEGGDLQHLVSGAQVFFLPENIRLKVGGFAGFGQNLSTEWMSYLSVDLPTWQGLRLEPTYYYIQPPNTSNTEHRVQLGLKYHPLGNGLELNLAGLYGQAAVPNESGEKDLFGWTFSGLIPVNQTLLGQFVVRQEKGVFYDFTSVALGLKVRINK